MRITIEHNDGRIEQIDTADGWKMILDEDIETSDAGDLSEAVAIHCLRKHSEKSVRSLDKVYPELANSLAFPMLCAGPYIKSVAEDGTITLKPCHPLVVG